MLQSKPVIVAVIINALLITLIPKVLTKPTNIKIIDDIVVFLNMQKGSLLTSSAYIAILMVAIEYAMQYSEGIQSPLSVLSPE
jgi:hypothetical protein